MSGSGDLKSAPSPKIESNSERKRDRTVSESSQKSEHKGKEGNDELTHDSNHSKSSSTDATNQRNSDLSPLKDYDRRDRLLIFSNKMKNTGAIVGCAKPNVKVVLYKYHNTTIDGILEKVEDVLRGAKVESIGFVLHSSPKVIYLCGKEEKTITMKNIIEEKSVRDFFQKLVQNYIDLSWVNARIDFLSCRAVETVDGGLIVRELTDFLQLPVGMSKDLFGEDCLTDRVGEDYTVPMPIGELYFSSEKLRTSSAVRILAGFEKIKTVGKGAYGAAVLYRKKDNGTLVILKEINLHDLNATERASAQNEVKVLSQLEHPNVIGYYDSFEEDGILMIEMEYAEGGNLAQCLSQRDAPLQEREIVKIFSQIVSALDYIHKNKILHRDLKTDNIFLTTDGTVKLGDFGIAKMMTSENKKAYSVVGTPYYISPEMCEGKPYNEKSDIWALGCVLYEMACQQKTFEGTNLPALVNKIMKGQFAPVRAEYSSKLKELIHRLLEKEPDYRPSANEMLSVYIPDLWSEINANSPPPTEAEVTLTRDMPASRTIRSVLYYFDSYSMDFLEINGLPPLIRILKIAVGMNHVAFVSTDYTVHAWSIRESGNASCLIRVFI